MNQYIQAPNWGRLGSSDKCAKPFTSAYHQDVDASVLPYGNGRSYGDTCHNDDGILLTNNHRNAIIDFDPELGVIKAQTGIKFVELLQFLRHTNWFIPVVPGTKFITLGGAIANDIHGKNHETRGTFGCHVLSFELHRSNGDIFICSRSQNEDYFNATIAGMGLTGFVSWVEFQLIKVASHHIEEKKETFHSINEFISLSEESDSDYEYNVAWIDSLASGKNLGKGVMMMGRHAHSPNVADYDHTPYSVPFTPPFPVISGPALKLFNLAYYHRNASQTANQLTSPNAFFFPLDALENWNKLYGPRGLYQHQSCIPEEAAAEAIPALIRTSQLAGQGSFLTVLKKFGEIRSPGLLSFPKPGFTLTLDFPNKGEKTVELLKELDAITLSAGGRTNPYKDARMSAETFQTGFPNWQDLEALRDPAFVSGFWRRTTNLQQVDAPPLETPLSRFDQVDLINQVTKPNFQETNLD